MKIEKEDRQLKDHSITLVHVTTPKMQVTLSSLGASIWSFKTQDKHGVFENITLSYHSKEDYLENKKYLGTSVGPYAGRIYPPSFTLNGVKRTLPTNFMDHSCLHSAHDNLTTKNFDVSINDNTVIFSLIPGDTAFLGHTKHRALYTFTDHEMSLTYESETNQDTITNMTNHTYFNLSGNAKRTVMNHTLQFPSSQYVALDDYFIATAIESVEDTPFDFQSPKRIGEGVTPLLDSPQMGLDHPFMLDQGTIVLHESESGRTLEITTDQDFLIVYSNNFLIEETLEGNITDHSQLAICLECQHLPNDIHFMKDPKSFHKKGTIHTQTTTYKVI